MVQRVEGFGAELGTEPFGEAEVFLEGENDVSEVGRLFGVATEGAGLADGGNDLGGGGARGKGKPLAAIGGTVDGSREVINAVVQGSESVVGVSQEGKLGAAAGEEEAG